MNNSSDPEICRLLDHDNAVYLSVDKESGNIYAFIYYNRYLQEPIEYNNSFLVIDTYIYYNLEEDMELFGHGFQFVH